MTLTNALGAAFFVFLFIIRVMQFSGGDWISILLALQSALAAFLLVMHKPVERVSHPIMSAIAWLCALLPLAFKLEDANVLYSLPGLLLALWSLIVLGFSFSIAPEDRGIVARGPYRLVRHPMYLGEVARGLAREYRSDVARSAEQLSNKLLFPISLYIFVPFMLAIFVPLMVSVFEAF